MIRIRPAVPLLLVAFSAALLDGQVRDPTGAAPDSTPAREHLFVRRDAYIAGGFAVATVALFPLDKALARDAQDSSFQAIRFARSAAHTLSVAGHGVGWALASGVLYGTGRVTHSEALAETGVHTLEALVVANALTLATKDLAGRARPLLDVNNPHDFKLGRGFGDDDHQSFPSGHASSSFAGAAAITSEVSAHWPHATRYVAPALYGTATLVGLSRMYNNKHWASDVVVGAAIGTFSGLKVVRYNHAHHGNWIDRALLDGLVTPVAGGGVAFSVHRSF